MVQSLSGGGDAFGDLIASEALLAVGGVGESSLSSNAAMMQAMGAPAGGAVMRHAQSGGALEPAQVAALVSRSRGAPLPSAIAQRFGEAMGYDFSTVRVHTDASATAAAHQLNARAFAVQDHVYFDRQRFQPGTVHGDRLLAHELTHVIQHGRGQLPTGGAGLQVSSPSDGPEREAYAAEAHIQAALSLADAALESHALAAGAAPAASTGADAGADLAPISRRERRPGEVLSSLPSSGGRPMPAEQQARFEAAFGRPLGHVRIHSDAAAANAAEGLRAHAFTVGADVYFGRGEYAPGTTAGDRLLAHELTHVVQDDEGRLGGMSGVSSPSDATEREAYANEDPIVSALAVVDAALLGSDGEPTAEADTSSYSGAPTIQRDASEESAEGEARHGPTTTEEAAMGPLPSVEPSPPAVAPADTAAPAAEPSPAVSADAASIQVEAPPAPTAEEQASGERAPVQTQGSAGSGAGAEASGAVVSDPVLGADIGAWVTHAHAEGERQAQDILSAARQAQARIDAAQQAAVQEARASFAEGRARIEAAASSSITSIQSRLQSGLSTISAVIEGERSRLQAGIEERRATAEAAQDASRAQISAAVERESARADAAFAERKAAAEALAEAAGSGGDEPLATGQADIAARVSEETAAHCDQTAKDTRSELSTAGAACEEGLAAFQDAFDAALGEAQAAGAAALDTVAADAATTLREEAEQAQAAVTSYREEGVAQLDDQERQVVDWLSQQAQTERELLLTEADTRSLEVREAYGVLAEQFDVARPALEEARATSTPDQLAEAEPEMAAALSEQWRAGVSELASAVAQIQAAFDQQAAEIESGFSAAIAQAASGLASLCDQVVAELGATASGFDQLAQTAESATQETVTAGVDEALTQADAAEAERAAQVDACVQGTDDQMRAALDEQLQWQDGHIAEAQGKIAEGQEQLSSDYSDLKGQAQQQGSGASAAVMRGWLGDLWDFFDDLADSVLEWFQEKLGKVLGNIIGGILWGIIKIVGVVACWAAWSFAQTINLIWGFIWGETAIPGYGGGFYAFIGDLIAGILIYGDVRDVIKYLIVHPLMGKGPWWFNVLMVVIAAIGLIPLFGDGLKAIVKQIFKSGVKSALKEIAEIIGEEIAEKLIKELGEQAAKEVAEDLVGQVGKEVAQKLVKDMTGQAAKELVEDVGALTVKRLLKEVSGPTIKELYDDLGQEALEKLGRTLGGSTIEQLNRDLGPDALKRLLTGLRGSTIKEYFDALGKDALKALSDGLDGYAVKTLFDDLGAPALKALTGDLNGAAIKQLHEALGKDVLTTLATKLDGSVIKKLVDDIGGESVKTLLNDLGEVAFSTLAKDLTGPVIKELHEKLTGPVLKQLAEEMSGPTIKELYDELGEETLKRFTGSLGAPGLKELTDAIGAKTLKEFTEELGEDVIEELGVKALKEVAPHLSPDDLMELLTAPGTSLSFIRNLCEQAGAGPALKAAAGHFGSFEALGKIFVKAEAHAVPEAAFNAFLKDAPSFGWKSIKEIDEFFKWGAASASTWPKILDWGRTFSQHCTGAGTKVKGRTVAGTGGLASQTVSGAKWTFEQHDVLHILSRHSWENFPPSSTWAKAHNGFWNVGVTQADLVTVAQDVFKHADFEALVRSGAQQGVVAGKYGIQLDHGIKGLVSIYDVTADLIDKEAMKAIIWLFKSK